MNKQTQSSADLAEAYRKAQVKILSSIDGTNPQTIRMKFEKTLQTVVTSLDTANAKAVEQNVADGATASQRRFVSRMSAMFDGRSFTAKDLSAVGLDIKNQRIAQDVLDRKAQYAKDTAVYRQNFLELRGKLVGVSRALQGEVNDTLKDLSGKAENTITNAISELKSRLKEQGCFNVQYSNGASVGVDKYATMVCRSARTESANAENIRISKAFGTDLVECIGNDVTCEVCAQYRGRVFSVSGQDKRYPPLRDGTNSPLKNGYDLIHPNCRCEFRAYFEALHSEEENEAKRKFSNRPFDGDKRTAEQARAYQEWQTVQRRAIDEQRRWNELQSLGENNPYSDIGALRRALRSDKDSFAYKKSHYAVRDFKQYERWKRILGEENMPKNLAEFQDLKYNNPDRFEALNNQADNAYLDMDYETIKKKIGKLSNVKVRKWYDKNVRAIATADYSNMTLEEHARAAFEKRNEIREQARDLMADEDMRTKLQKVRPEKSFDEMIAHKREKYGGTIEDIYEGIIKTASTTNDLVNKILGVNDEDG